MMEEVSATLLGSLSQPLNSGKRVTSNSLPSLTSASRDERDTTLSGSPRKAEFTSDKKTREAGDGEVGLQEFLRGIGGAEDGFGGEVAAADGAFHGGGPAGGGPIAGEEETGSFCFL